MGAPRVSHSDRGELGTAQRNLRKRNAATLLRKLCVFNFASLSGLSVFGRTYVGGNLSDLIGAVSVFIGKNRNFHQIERFERGSDQASFAQFFGETSYNHVLPALGRR
jgi:hypothetical protein